MTAAASEAERTPPQRNDSAPASEAGQGGGMALIVSAACLGVAFAAGAIVVIYHREAGLAGLALLLGIAAVGIGVLAALAFERHKPGGRERRGRLLEQAFEMFSDPMAVTRPDGSVLFANQSYRDLCAANGTRAAAPEHALQADADMAARLYRLARTGAEGGAATADIRTSAGGAAQWRRVSVESLVRSGAKGRERLTLWRLRPLAEVTSGGSDEPATVLSFTRPPTARGQAPSLYEDVFAASPAAALLTDGKGRIVHANGAFAALTGPGANGDQLSGFIDAEDRPALGALLARAVKSPGKSQPAVDLRLAGGKTVTVIALALPGGDSNGRLALFVSDNTDLRSLERQFVQAQKMEAIGKLAGGVAHDFNNILTAMIGFTDLLLQTHRPGDPSYGDLMQIKTNGNRGASLVRQLLAFSRQQTLTPRVHSLSDLVTEVSDMLRRLITEKVSLVHELGREVWPVKVDGPHFDNMIINLAVNARDAMKAQGGGTLVIRTANVPEAACDGEGHPELPPGDYVRIEVADTGTGIPAELINKIFEPFFTTKGVGEGTGLGLSGAFGFVKQSGGFMFVRSETGQGTTFRIYLPRYVEEASEAAASEPVAARPRDLTGKGTILLVEDDDAVRIFSSRALSQRGYVVLAASGGEEALELIKKPGQTIDLIVTDVVMPGMDGPELVSHAKSLTPGVKVIFMSGYAEDAFRKQAADETVHFLQKPFEIKQLATKVKDVIEAAA